MVIPTLILPAQTTAADSLVSRAQFTPIAASTAVLASAAALRTLRLRNHVSMRFQSADRTFSSRQARFLVTETNALAIGAPWDNKLAYDGQWRQAAWAEGLINR